MKIKKHEFLKYLEHRDLIHSETWIVNSGAYAIVFTEPDPEDFTKVEFLGQGRWKASLRPEDFKNGKITNNFFSFETESNF